LLGFGTRNESPGVAGEKVSTELGCAEEVLERNSLRAAFHQVAQWGAFRFAERALKLKVKVDAFLSAEGMCQEILGIQARALHALLMEVGGRRVEDFKCGHQCGGVLPKSAEFTVIEHKGRCEKEHRGGEASRCTGVPLISLILPSRSVFAMHALLGFFGLEGFDAIV
jgi:hypothetical protein